MAAYRAGVEDDKDSCMSCLNTTEYRCLRCSEPLCNKCSLPEENDDIPGWKAGKFVSYCVPYSKEAFGQGTQCSTHASEEMAERVRGHEKGAILTLP